MSTRSLICKELPNGMYKQIYCHNQSFLFHNGCILQNHYNTTDKVDKLLSLGDLYLLDISTEKDKIKQHDRNKRQFGVCVAYRRDLKEKSPQVRDCTFDKVLDNARNAFAEYVYLYTKKGKWMVIENEDIQDESIDESNKNKVLKDLSETIEKSVAVEDRYDLTLERAKLMNQLIFKIDDEMARFVEGCNFLEPLNVFDKSFEISSVKAVKSFLDYACERMTSKEIKHLLAKRDLLESLASDGAFSYYDFNERARKATHNYLYNCLSKDKESEIY